MLNQQSCVWKVVNQCSQADKSVLHTSLKQIAKESVENIKKKNYYSYILANKTLLPSFKVNEVSGF